MRLPQAPVCQRAGHAVPYRAAFSGYRTPSTPQSSSSSIPASYRARFTSMTRCFPLRSRAIKLTAATENGELRRRDRLKHHPAPAPHRRPAQTGTIAAREPARGVRAQGRHIDSQLAASAAKATPNPRNTAVTLKQAHGQRRGCSRPPAPQN